VKKIEELKELLTPDEMSGVRAAWNEDRCAEEIAFELGVSRQLIVDYLLAYCESEMSKQAVHHLNVLRSEIQSKSDRYERGMEEARKIIESAPVDAEFEEIPKAKIKKKKKR